MPQYTTIAGRVMHFADANNPNAMGFVLQPFLTLARGSSWVKPDLSLVALEGGYALRLEVKHKESIWLLAEKSGQIRVFRRADTALELCRRLGLSSVMVRFQEAERRPFG